MSLSVFVRRVAMMWVCAMAFSVPIWAQGAGSTIQGTVKDESGGAMPGVTATVSAPELQVGKIAVVTAVDGTYRIGELPAGTYRITFELPGFKTVVQSDFRLAIGFVARVDATMNVGGLEESVTVSGASPVVDLTTTTTSSVLSRRTLDAVPLSQGITAVYNVTPGLTTSVVDVGGSKTGNRIASQNYGPGQVSTIRIEGIDIADGTDTGVYSSSFGIDEVQVRTSGNNAEVSPPGTAMVGVLKSGSNEFHGTYYANEETPGLQSNNITPLLRAQGLTSTNPIKHQYDASGDFGGRIVKDKLWFYLGGSRQDRLTGVPGYVLSPANPTPAFVETRMLFSALKLSYQATPKNRFIFAWTPNDKSQPEGLPLTGACASPCPQPSRFDPASSGLDFENPTWMSKGEFQSVLNARMVLDVVGGTSGFHGLYCPQCAPFAAPVGPSNPSTFDLQTGISGGTNSDTVTQYSNNWDVNGSLSILPDRFLGGHHELKVGASLNWHEFRAGENANLAGDYVLMFNQVNGVPHQPTQIQFYNGPVNPDPRTTLISGYLQDTWKVSKTVTLNLGVRNDRAHGYIAKQSRGASPDFPTLFPAAAYQPIDLLTWNMIVPRLGVAWNLAEKTVVKATFNRFMNQQPGGPATGGAKLPNPMSTVIDTFKWHNIEGDGLYHPDDVNLDPNGPDFLSTTALLPQLSESLRPPKTNEVTGSLEREVANNLGIQVLYVFKNVRDQYTTTNILRPPNAWDIPLTRIDPGPTGVIGGPGSGAKVTIWDFDPAFAGAKFVQNVLRNYPSLNDHYQTIQFAMTKRQSNRWSATAAVWATKWHQHLVIANNLDPSNPNNDANAVDEQLRWAWNLTGTYSLPWDVQLAAYAQGKIGIVAARTNLFGAVDPSGGPSLHQQSTVTQNMDAPGSDRGAAINVVNLRASKSFSLGGSRRVEFDADLFNVLNSSAPLVISFPSGPAYGYASDVVPARLARLGVRYTF
jgi:hypothetical protein